MKGGHRKTNPDSSKYTGLVSMDNIRVLITHAAMHGTPICAAGIRNACLPAPTLEKHFIVCGDTFGLNNDVKKALITGARYDGNCAGQDFCHQRCSCMEFLGVQVIQG